MRNLTLSIASSTLLATSAVAEKVSTNNGNPELAAVGMDQTEGCMTGPMAQFGRYIGDWDMTDWTLSQDGQNWTQGKGARWNFTCVGNGIAVQDFWMPAGGGQGTNLRIYDPKKESWDIAWTAKASPGFSHITAKQDEAGNIVMHYVSPKPTPARRITFFEPEADGGWNWHLDISTDGEKTWRTVFKMKATRR